jgi:MFS transporter, MHS family, proline/betaine transporter
LLTFYLIRPVGGVVLGAYADRHGRKVSLMISIVLTLGTFAIAFMPTYETIHRRPAPGYYLTLVAS